ncbi:hypothetical protein C8R47DRAFT_938705, partial [Mycena vitilis]
LGPLWKGLVERWWERETDSGFVVQAKGLGGKKRPSQVKDWVSRARKAGYTPPIANAAQFGREFVTWWVDINPVWRTKDLPMGRFTDGSWDVLDVPGRNGMLNVLMCLKWWAEKLGAEEAVKSGEWIEAVTDVAWVIDRL